MASMRDVNSLTIGGRLVAAPESTTLPSGTKVCDFRIASNRGTDRDKNELAPAFYDVKVWNGNGENCQQYLVKGQAVIIEGSLNFREWTAEDGSKRSRVFITAQSVHFGNKPKDAAAPAAPSEEDFVAAAQTGETDDIPF